MSWTLIQPCLAANVMLPQSPCHYHGHGHSMMFIAVFKANTCFTQSPFLVYAAHTQSHTQHAPMLHNYNKYSSHIITQTNIYNIIHVLFIYTLYIYIYTYCYLLSIWLCYIFSRPPGPQMLFCFFSFFRYLNWSYRKS